MRSCRNCDAPLTGEFCANCGQRDRPLKEPFWVVLGRVFGDVFSLDSRMGRTVRPFLFRPGFLTREFNEGRRTRYSAPFRLYLLASLALFLSFDVQRRAAAWDETMNVGESSEVATETSDPSDPSEPNGQGAASSAESGKTLRFDFGSDAERRELLGEDSRIYRAWNRQQKRFENLSDREQVELMVSVALGQAPTMLLLMLPLFALILRLAHLRSGHVFAEHFVFALHVQAFFCAALLVPTLVSHPLSWIFVAVAIPTYFVLALRSAYGARPLPTALRALVVFPLYLAMFVPVILTLMVLGVFGA